MTRSTPLAGLFTLIAACVIVAPSWAHDEHAKEAEPHHEEHAHEDDHAHDEDHAHGQGGQDTAHAFESGGVKIVHPWMNTTNGRDVLIYLDLENTGASPVFLQGAEVPFAESATLVGFTLQNGEGTYQPLPFVPVQPGHSLELAPEGLAIFASGLKRGFVEGDTAVMTLLTSSGAIDLTVVVEASYARQHSHAGHAH